MFRQKWVWYAREIIKDGSRVNQNAVKRNMEARNKYLLEKKGSEKKAEIEADQVPLTVTVKRNKKQLRLEAINNTLTKSNDKAHNTR